MRKPYDQKPGTRIKPWDLGDSPRASIEATAEAPVMYTWLGTEPRTKHPFNVYGDILSQLKALRDTFALNQEIIPDLARRLVERGYTGMWGYGLGTSQYAPKTALGSFWGYAGWDARASSATGCCWRTSTRLSRCSWTASAPPRTSTSS